MRKTVLTFLESLLVPSFASWTNTRKLRCLGIVQRQIHCVHTNRMKSKNTMNQAYFFYAYAFSVTTVTCTTAKTVYGARRYLNAQGSLPHINLPSDVNISYHWIYGGASINLLSGNLSFATLATTEPHIPRNRKQYEFN